MASPCRERRGRVRLTDADAARKPPIPRRGRIEGHAALFPSDCDPRGGNRNQRDPLTRRGGPERQQGVFGGASALRYPRVFVARAGQVAPSRLPRSANHARRRARHQVAAAPQPRAQPRRSARPAARARRARGGRSAPAQADPADAKLAEETPRRQDATRRGQEAAGPGPLRGGLTARLSGRLLQPPLLLQPLGFELRQLARDVGLVEDQRLQRLVLPLAVGRRIGKARVDLRFLRVQLRHFLFQPLDARLDRFPRRGLALALFRFLAFLPAPVDRRCRDRRLLRFGQRYGFFRGCELGLEQPVAVVLQISVEGCEAALGDDEELVGGG